MCNYNQTNFANTGCGCGNTRWNIQRICYDCNGNIQVIVNNGCVCRRLTYSLWDENACLAQANTFNNGCGGSTTTQTTENGCYARTNGGCPYATTYPFGGRCGCGCGGTF